MSKSRGLPPFELMLDRHGPAIHRFLVARVGTDRADDCFQETMIAALRAWDGVRDRAKLRSWLFTIAVNKANDSHRAAARAPVPDEGIEARAAASGSDPVFERVGGGTADPVWDAVGLLPDKQAAAVTLRFRGDLTHREVGEVLGMSEDAARRNVFEGLKRLRVDHAERIRDERTV